MKKLSDLGERQAIQLIFNILTKKYSDVGLGDDCAVVEIDDDFILISTDMISKKTHISEEMTPFQIGWFVVAINLSDIASKGGKPLGIVLSYGLPKNLPDKDLAELTKGADACATNFQTFIIGGDTKETNEITICGTAIGIVKKDEFIPRKGANIDDVVAVTGPLGKAGAGFLSLKNKKFFKEMSKFLFEPVPKLNAGRFLAKQKCISCCMDLSDGLSSSLYQLSKINNLGFEIDKDKIPITKSLYAIKIEKPSIDMFNYALHFGGDYELLLTIPSNNFKKIKLKMKDLGLDLFEIGRVIRERKIFLKTVDKRINLENKGYEHFKNHFFNCING